MISILDWYVAGIMGRAILAVLIVFITFMVLIVGINELSHVRERGADWGLAFTYVLYKLPQEVFPYVPMAVLIGSLLGTFALTRHGELAAILGGGIPLIRAAAATWWLAGLFGITVFWANEWVFAPAYQQALHLYNIHIDAYRGASFKGGTLYRGSGFKLYYYNTLDLEQERPLLRGMDIHILDPNTRQISETIRSEQAEYDPTTGRWTLFNGTSIRWATTPLSLETFEQNTIRIAETPNDLVASQLEPRQMSFYALAHIISQRLRDGSPCTTLYPDLHFKLSLPITCIIMALIGVGTGASSFLSSQPGAGRYAFSMGYCIGIAMVYQVIMETTMRFARTGDIAGYLGVWVPTVVFAIFALVYLNRASTS